MNKIALSVENLTKIYSKNKKIVIAEGYTPD